MFVTQMEQSEAGATGDGMESLGPGDGGHGIDYEFVQTDKDSLGFVGVDRVKQLKRDVRKALEDKAVEEARRKEKATKASVTKASE